MIGEEMNRGHGIEATRRGRGRPVRKSRLGTLKTGGVGSGIAAMTEAIRLHPSDPLKQMTAFLAGTEVQAFTGRRRRVSEETLTKFGETLIRAVKELRSINMPIQRIDQIGRRQALALVAYWVNEKGQGPSTVAGKLSNLRKYCTLTGKKDAIPKRAALYEVLETKGVSQEALSRVQVTAWSKNWTSQGVDPLETIEGIRQNNPHEALLMETMLAWGLRVSEALGLQPHRSEQPDGLLISRETKGGRWRNVSYLKDPEQAAYQRDVLERCKTWAQRTPILTMGYEGLSMEQARKRFYNTMAKCGISHGDLGVVCHGLRHEFAGNMFYDITGHRPPAEGEEPPKWFQINRGLVRDAYRRVSEALGHWRPDISAAYLGSLSKMSKVQVQRIEKSIGLFHGSEAVMEGLSEAGVMRLWITGRAATGAQMPPNDPLILSAFVEPGGDLADQVAQVKAVLREHFPLRTVIDLQLNDVPPNDAVEVFLNL